MGSSFDGENSGRLEVRDTRGLYSLLTHHAAYRDRDWAGVLQELKPITRAAVERVLTGKNDRCGINYWFEVAPVVDEQLTLSGAIHPRGLVCVMAPFFTAWIKRKGHSVAQLCREASISRSTFYNLSALLDPPITKRRRRAKKSPTKKSAGNHDATQARADEPHRDFCPQAHCLIRLAQPIGFVMKAVVTDRPHACSRCRPELCKAPMTVAPCKPGDGPVVVSTGGRLLRT